MPTFPESVLRADGRECEAERRNKGTQELDINVDSPPSLVISGYQTLSAPLLQLWVVACLFNANGMSWIGRDVARTVVDISRSPSLPLIA